ncbi:hypothetical protein GCM10011611_24930 [Aliidongia dinghuensis]|uniref:Uncharacterized protein n=1 Tax=Aliidongia dinghuensis TaxID=1867774 RepID=A0A8J2YT89_9PROT|nr:hypothetical protein [Aliidongia dinghuensis]GGF18095.1 hypothetical protein GCM10011611_24930 [Aliidongia dinghuensis]
MFTVAAKVTTIWGAICVIAIAVFYYKKNKNDNIYKMIKSARPSDRPDLVRQYIGTLGFDVGKLSTIQTYRLLIRKAEASGRFFTRSIALSVLGVGVSIFGTLFFLSKSHLDLTISTPTTVANPSTFSESVTPGPDKPVRAKDDSTPSLAQETRGGKEPESRNNVAVSFKYIDSSDLSEKDYDGELYVDGRSVSGAAGAGSGYSAYRFELISGRPVVLELRPRGEVVPIRKERVAANFLVTLNCPERTLYTPFSPEKINLPAVNLAREALDHEADCAEIDKSLQMWKFYDSTLDSKTSRPEWGREKIEYFPEVVKYNYARALYESCKDLAYEEECEKALQAFSDLTPDTLKKAAVSKHEKPFVKSDIQARMAQIFYAKLKQSYADQKWDDVIALAKEIISKYPAEGEAWRSVGVPMARIRDDAVNAYLRLAENHSKDACIYLRDAKLYNGKELNWPQERGANASYINELWSGHKCS